VSFESNLERLLAELRATSRHLVFSSTPSLAGAALSMESRTLGAASIPHFFARDIERIPPTLNDDLLELYGRSEQALANRFGFFGETETSESEINWQPARSKAWRTELHAFDYALDLALTFRISGNARFAWHLRYLMAAWIAANPPGRGTAWNSFALARRIRNWTLAADLAREAFDADAEFFEVFIYSLAQQATYLVWEARTIADRRARLMASRALLAAGRFFARGESLCEFASSLLKEALADGYPGFPDHPQPLRQFELASACAEHVFFRESDDELPRTALASAIETLEGMLHPDGTLPLFGREPLPAPEAMAALFSLGAAALGVPQWKSLAGGEIGLFPYMLLGESGKQRFDKMPNEPWRAISRLESKSDIFRISDGESSAMLISAALPVSPLGHRDLFSYELTIHGQRTAVDSGVASIAGSGLQDDLCAALHHNVLLVDGRMPEIDAAHSVRAVTVDTLEGIKGIWLGALLNSAGGNSPKSGEKEMEFLRGFFLVAGKYWLVIDCLDGTGAHQLESLIHFYPAFSLEERGDCVTARSGAASVTVRPLLFSESNGQSTAKLGIYREGWYAPTSATKYPNTTLVMTWEQASFPAWFAYVIDSAGEIVRLGFEIAGREAKARIILHRSGKQLPIEIPCLSPPE
jgi:hypothetical protein